MRSHMDIDDAQVRRTTLALTRVVEAQSLEIFLTGRAEPYLKQRATARFRRQGDDRTGRWKPLAESTKRKREAEGFPASRPINIRTGELHDYITKGPSLHGAGAGQAYLVLPGPGADEEQMKAVMAQRGSSDGRTPARPVLAISEVDTRQLTRRLNWWVNESLEMALGGTWQGPASTRTGSGF